MNDFSASLKAPSPSNATISPPSKEGSEDEEGVKIWGREREGRECRKFCK